MEYVVLTLRRGVQEIHPIAPGQSPHCVARTQGAILYEVVASLPEARETARANAQTYAELGSPGTLCRRPQSADPRQSARK